MAGGHQQVPARFAAVYEGYSTALEGAPLDADTRRAYTSRVRSFLAWLGAAEGAAAERLTSAGGHDLAAAYQTYLRTGAKRSASTVNAHLTALDHFYKHLGMGGIQLGRDPLPRRSPRILTGDEQERYLGAVMRQRLARDRAIGQLLYHAGLSVSELVALDVDDVPVSTRTGRVIVRQGSSRDPRTVPLVDRAARREVAACKGERASWAGADTSALFLNRRGGRLSARSIGHLVDRFAAGAGLVDERGKAAVSAQDLRDTFGANLGRDGAGASLIAALMGYRAAGSARPHALPAAAADQ